MNRSIDTGAPYLPSPEAKSTSELRPTPPENTGDTLDNLPKDVQLRATEAMLRLMEEVLRGIDNYAVFASTAMYLEGKRTNDARFQVPPGDLDVAVGDEATLRKIFERLQNVPGVTFDAGGIARPFPGQEAQVLAGKIHMAVGEYVVPYPFEFFFENRIVDEKVFSQRERVGGLHALKREGLLDQYKHNLEFDRRVERASEDVAEFLSRREDELQSALSGKGDRALLEVVLNTYALTEAQLREFYQVYSSLAGATEKERERLRSKISLILGGVKTKVAKRLRNVQQLHGHSSP